MPIYEYQCKKCGKRFEALEGVNDATLTTCLSCLSEAERVISAPNLKVNGYNAGNGYSVVRGDKSK